MRLASYPFSRSSMRARQVGREELSADRFLDALQSTCAEWTLLSDRAEEVLSKSAGEMGPS
jgi:hypothetical protein